MPAVFCAVTIVFYWPILICKGFLWNDFLDQNFVYRLFSAVSLKQGIIPFWNPYVFSGMPFFADVQAAVLYPLNFVLTIFASSDWLNPVLVEYQVVFHIFLAGCFMYLLARELGTSRSGGLLSGVTFMFCGFLTTHIFHTNLIHAAAWFPLAVFLFKRTIDRMSLLYMSLTALTLTVIFLCGYPQLMVHMYYWLAAYYCFGLMMRIRQKAKVSSEVKRFALFAALVVLSIGMTSVQLLPGQELARNSVRPKLSFSESCEGSFRPYRFVTMLVPNYFGVPQKSAYWGVSASDVNGGVHSYWETAIYTGVVPLALACIAPFFVRTPMVLFLSLMAVISFLLAMGDSFFLYALSFKFLPALNAFRIPARFAFLFSVSAALLSGLCMTRLQKGNHLEQTAKQRGTIVRGLMVAAGVCVAWALLFSAGTFKTGIADFICASGSFGSNGADISSYVDRQIYPAIVKGVWLFVLFFLVFCGCTAARLAGRISARTMALVMLAATVLDFLAFGSGFAAGTIDPSVMYEKTPAISELQQMQRAEYFRINSRSSNTGTDDLGGSHMLFRKNQGSVHRLFLMEGYNPLRLKRQLVDRKDRTLDVLNVKFKIAVDEARQSMSLVPHPTYLPRARMVYDYAVMPDENAILPRLHDPSFDHRKTVILEEKPDCDIQTTAPNTSWTCRIESYSLNRIDMDVTTARNGILVLSEIQYPSWKATVDGREVPLYRADYALRAIPVEKGSHRVSCYFSPDVFKKGLALSLLSFAVCCIAFGLGLVIPRRRAARNCIRSS